MGAVLQISTPKSRRQLGKEERACLRLFPRGQFGTKSKAKNTAWMYAVGLTNGLVKIGVTSTPRDRLRTHWNGFGGAVEWVHLFGRVQRQRHGMCCAAERAAIASCEAAGERIATTELFRGLTKAQVLAHCRAAIAATTSGA